MSQSAQEDFVRALLEIELGAAFAVVPKKWVNAGGQPHECCDIAWICNNAAFLFTMTSRNRKSADWMMRHNLDQLRGWLREWARGERLVGSNSFQSFDIGFDDVEHHVLISVVDGANAAGMWHKLSAKDLDTRARRTALAVSLPAPVVKYVLGHGGGPHALLDLAMWLHDEHRQVPADELLVHVDEMHRVATERAIAASGHQSPPNMRIDARNLIRSTMITEPRVAQRDGTFEPYDRDGVRLVVVDRHQRGTEAGMDPYSAGGFLEMLNDLQWHELLQLLGTITRVWSQFDVPAGTMIPFLPLDFRPGSGCTISIGALPRGDKEEEITHRWLAYIGHLSELSDRGVLGILYTMDFLHGPVFVAMPFADRTGDSHLSQRLRGIRQVSLA